jgi:predicted ThiF/HesA family dinucleotide-utilizing enzyme
VDDPLPPLCPHGCGGSHCPFRVPSGGQVAGACACLSSRMLADLDHVHRVERAVRAMRAEFDAAREALRTEGAQMAADVAAAHARVVAANGRAHEARLAAESLREANAGLRRELDTARAILAGRSTPPTDAEIEAHDAAGGSWLTNRGVVGLGFSEVLEIEFPGGSILTGQRVEDVALGIEWWIALDAHGRPCAWPVVEVDHG